MKYRSITLNGNKRHNYRLVKYTTEYKIDLEELKNINYELAECVEQCPTIYSEQSDHQSYMIFNGRRNCVGAIYIGTSSDEKNLEIKLQFKEEDFRTQEDVVAVIEQLIDSLGLYFSDKESIEIELCNDIDLSKFNSARFKKKVYDAKLTTYICSNQRNYIVIPAVIEEMNQTEKVLANWGEGWIQTLNLDSYPNIDDIDSKLVDEEYKNGTASIQEMFYKAESIFWHGITSKKSTRNIEFSRNGKIHFNKSSKDSNGIKYDFDYYVLSDGFDFKTYGWFDKRNLEIEDNSYYTKIKQGKVNILRNKESKRKRIRYTTSIINDSSIEVELWTNDENVIERCYIDFRTHKGNGKVNGLYALRILPQYRIFTLNFISRDGIKYVDFSKTLTENNEELFSTIFDGNLTFELIDELVKKIIPIINRRAIRYSRKVIDQQNSLVISNIVDMERQAINFIKQIKGEIPLPHLQSNIENFIVENDRSYAENQNKELRLQNEQGHSLVRRKK